MGVACLKGRGANVGNLYPKLVLDGLLFTLFAKTRTFKFHYL